MKAIIDTPTANAGDATPDPPVQPTGSACG